MSKTPQTYSILGAARSGLAVARLLRREGARVFVSDVKPAESCGDARHLLESIGADYEFGGHSSRVLESTVLVLSPGVADTLPIVRQAREHGLEITNEIEIAARRCRAPIVAITGTNGKTTTSELTGFIFRSSGMNTYVAGNVGLPFSEIVADADERSVVVLEVSSFQLEHISTFRPRVAVLLNVTPDHLDRYGSFEEYVKAKFRITMNQTADDTLIYNRDDHNLSALPEQSMARAIGFSLTQELPFGAFARDGMLILRDPTNGTEEQLMQTQEIRIRGPHNLYNSMAAALAARTLGVGFSDIRNGLRNFPGVAHRLEPVRELDGVRYVNDSKATNVDSLWYALNSFSTPIVLIAGGKGKKNEYEPILSLIDERVRAVVLVGDAAAEMEKAFSGHATVVHAGYDMDAAVRTARSLAHAGDVVLLSPACASFDMFDNYEHRGEVFKSLVHRLQSVSVEIPTGESTGGNDNR
jgi:UDP-N-acetylmuramoylalanine--D-glutamate ligase